jgi:signal transduction histidine kinase
LEWLVAAKDSFYSYNNAEAIADLQAKYELSEKEKSIAQQKVQLLQKNLFLLAGGGLSLLVIGGMLYGFFRYRKKQRLRMKAALEEEKRRAKLAQLETAEHERKRIVADLHDNLGAYGAAIKNNLVQLKQQNEPSNMLLRQMEENVRHMVDELGNTIWVLNKSNQTLTTLYDSLKTWTRRLLNNYPNIKCRFEEEIETDLVLTPNQSLQWLYILQEAINNAVKHSGSGQIRIQLQAGPGWKAMVTDEGRGLGSHAGGGQGLNSIRERCAKMGWMAEWITPASGGTTFRVSGSAQNHGMEA